MSSEVPEGSPNGTSEPTAAIPSSLEQDVARWSDCDSLSDPIARLDCRTSHLNDGFHELTRAVMDMQQQLLEIGRTSHAGNNRLTWVGVVVGPLVGAAIKILTDHIHL